MHDMGRFGVKPDSPSLASAPCPRVQIERAPSSSDYGAWQVPVSAQALPHLLSQPQVFNSRSSSLFAANWSANKAKDVPVEFAGIPAAGGGAADSETSEDDDGGVLVAPSVPPHWSHTVSVFSLSHHQ